MRGTRPAYTLETFLAKRVIVALNGCWECQGASTHHGYQVVSIAGKRRSAHRWVYEQAKGPIPEGLEIDHLCNNTCCVNPDHLEAVTHDENMRRRRSNECINGHDLTLLGARYSDGGCRPCAQQRSNRKVACDCGQVVSQGNLPRHLRRCREREVSA